eukprot:6200893-Pleurochrysis_carterae.AAC.2
MIHIITYHIGSSRRKRSLSLWFPKFVAFRSSTAYRDYAGQSSSSNLWVSWQYAGRHLTPGKLAPRL